MKKIRIMAFVSALFVFMFSFLMIKSSFKKSEDSSSSGINKARGEYKAVIVAKNNILPNLLISSDMVEEKEILIISDMIEGQDYFTKKDDVVGRISSSDIFSGEAISNKRSLDKDSKYGLANKIEKGMRAITIDVGPSSGVGGHIKVGDYVDILAVPDSDISALTAGNSQGIEQKFTTGSILPGLFSQGASNITVLHENMGFHFSFTAIQNLKVLAIGNITTYSSNEASNDSASTNSYTTVTLQVTPAEAEKIEYIKADSTGHHISLTLRANGDHEIKDSSLETIIKGSGEIKNTKQNNADTEETLTSPIQSEENAQEAENTLKNNNVQADSANAENIGSSQNPGTAIPAIR